VNETESTVWLVMPTIERSEEEDEEEEVEGRTK
jgi:hypothetical protein